jgi:hypothetical protein
LLQGFDVLPELLPLLAFGLGQLGQGRFAPDAGEIRVLLPVLHRLQHGGTGFAGPAFQLLASGREVCAKLVECLATQRGAGFVVQRIGVLAFSAARQGCGAGGVLVIRIAQGIGPRGDL